MGQARSEATRQAIIAAAVEIFEEVGYGSASLSDIIERAHVAKGGFYYHFHTKEELAAAIIEHANDVLGADFVATLGSPAPMMENLIRISFGGVDLMRQDKVARMGYQLRQAVNQISPAGQSALVQRRAAIISGVEAAVAQGDLNDDIDAEAVGHTIWSSLLGTQLLVEVCGDNPFTRLAQIWTVILAGTASPGSLSYFRQFVARLESHHNHLT